MTNEYEVAAVIELGNAQEVVLGEKEASSGPDSITGDRFTLYIVATDDND